MNTDELTERIARTIWESRTDEAWTDQASTFRASCISEASALLPLFADTWDEAIRKFIASAGYNGHPGRGQELYDRGWVLYLEIAAQQFANPFRSDPKGEEQ